MFEIIQLFCYFLFSTGICFTGIGITIASINCLINTVQSSERNIVERVRRLEMSNRGYD